MVEDPIETVQAPDCPGAGADEQTRLAAWRGGPRRQGYRPCVEVAREVALDFRITGINKGDHTAAKASPVPVNGSWLVAGDSGVLHRIGADGSIHWSAATQPSSFGLHGTPAVANGTAFVGAYDGALYAFDVETGDRAWRTQLGGSIGSSPAVHGGLVYVAVETPQPDGYVSIVDPSTGEELWRSQDPTDHPHSSVALAPGAEVFVVGANDGTLYGWNLTTREQAWTLETDGPIKGPILVYDGAAFFGSWDDRVYRVNLTTGEQVWSYETDGNVMSGPGVHPPSGTILTSSFDENVYALDADDGSLRWRSPIGGAGLSSPVVADGLVLVGSYDEHLYALDLRDGSHVWRHAAEGRVTSSVGLTDGHVAFTARADEHAGRLYVLEAAR